MQDEPPKNNRCLERSLVVQKWLHKKENEPIEINENSNGIALLIENYLKQDISDSLLFYRHELIKVLIKKYKSSADEIETTLFALIEVRENVGRDSSDFKFSLIES